MHQRAWRRSLGHPRQIAIKDQKQWILECLDEVSLGDRWQLHEDNNCPPVEFPVAAGSIVNFDRCAVGIA